MEPLSITASVVGIIAAASEAVKILGPYVTATRDAPKIEAQLLSEIRAISIILTALQQLIDNISSDGGTSTIKYASLIQVDQLKAVLADGVFLFSELQPLLHTLPPVETTSSGVRLLSSMQWIRKRVVLSAHSGKLQDFKLSITVILNILQSDSQARAEAYQQQLISSVNLLFERNQALTQMLLVRDGDSSRFATITPRRASTQTIRFHDDFDTSFDDYKSIKGAEGRLSLIMSKLHFEEDLKSSRVYRRAKRDTMDFSMRSSIARTHAWSIFSGLSLSDVSKISVLALPIYSEDIANPQHYKFGIESNIAGLPSNEFSRSIFHECVEMELQLSQFQRWPIAELITQKREQAIEELDPLSILISVFQHGHPLLMLVDHLDNSLRKKWENLLLSEPSQLTRNQAVSDFVHSCIDHLDIEPADCFTVSELLSDDTTNHTKVIRLVSRVLRMLTTTGIIQAAHFDSSFQISTSESSSIVFAINEFLRDERFYVSKLEGLLDVNKQLKLAAFGSTANETAADRLLDKARFLVDAQRRFLLRAEMLALKPFRDQTWYPLFLEWGDRSLALYVAFITGEERAKTALRSVVATAADGPDKIQILIANALEVLTLPSQRLLKYQGFLKELLQQEFSDDLKLAIISLENVADAVSAAVSAAVTAQELQDAHMALLDGLDEADKLAVTGLGNILLFDNAVVPSLYTNLMLNIQIYLYDRGIVQVKMKQRGGILGRRGKLRATQEHASFQRYSIYRIIKATDILEISPAWRQRMSGYEIEWATTIPHSPINSMFVGIVSSISRRNTWVKSLKGIQYNSKQRYGRLKSFSSHFNLVVIGGGGVDKSALTIQLVQERSLGGDDPTTITDSNRNRFLIDGQIVTLDVLDTAGIDEYSAMREQYMRTGDGFLLVYSITSRESFEELTTFKQQILRIKDRDYFPMILVGNKCSLESQRQVSRMEGHALAKSFGCRFSEVDAATNINVSGAFFDLVREIQRYDREWCGVV